MIVIAQNNSDVAQKLASGLKMYFAGVVIVQNAEELRRILLSKEVQLAVLDLELMHVEEVRHLVGTFTNLVVVCTHRAPDEQKWLAALSAGAAEFCHPEDFRAIVRAWHTPTTYRHIAKSA